MNSRLLKILSLLMFSIIVAQEQSIDFQQIENLIIERNPELRALEKNIESYKGSLRQSSLITNPELDFESVAGEESEIAAQLSQTIELGRKRHKRKQIAELELESAIISSRIKKAQILFEAKLVFFDILQAQQILRVKKETVAITEKFLESVQKRVVAGSLSPAEEARAQISLTSQIIDLNRTQGNLKSYWRQLSSYWGSKILNHSYAIGNMEYMQQLPPADMIVLGITKSPPILEKDIELQVQQAIIEAEKANRIPDITFSAGFSKTEGSDNSYVAGFSMPLQVFDRNQGTIQATNSLLRQLMEEKSMLEIEIETEVASIYSDLIMINEEIEALQNTILPSAENAYQIINEGYLQGKFGFLDVVDAQTTLYEAEENFWLAITDFNTAIARIEVLMGQPLESFLN